MATLVVVCCSQEADQVLFGLPSHVRDIGFKQLRRLAEASTRKRSITCPERSLGFGSCPSYRT